MWYWRRRLRVHWTTRRSKPVSPKGNQYWIFFGRTDAEAPILWSHDAKSRHIGKYPDPRKDWGQEEKGVTEDEMIEWHHRLNGHKFEQTLVDSKGQGSLACCSPWGCKELDTAWWLKNNNSNVYYVIELVFKLKMLGTRVVFLTATLVVFALQMNNCSCLLSQTSDKNSLK